MMTNLPAALRLRLTGRSLCLIALGLLLLPSLSGCVILGLMGKVLPEPSVPAKYSGLAGQTVAVMVWADDNGVQIDWPAIHLDTAHGIQSKLQVAQSTEKPKELENAKFTLNPAAVVEYQKNHPEVVAESIVDVAPRLGVTRLIYVEIHGFQTRSDTSIDLYRGSATGSIKVIEVINGKGRVAYSDDSLRVQFPKTGPQDGLPNRTDDAMYRGTLDAFTTQAVLRFFAHPESAEK
ncbi:MAG: hypothetical protein JWO87_2672 [Phycisphaerales bacterium]|nr:hypothetical protein [Phycisphaerales bacterium]MDB5301009.1 hypothetical protein [Phycisphaerales bacterium]MDB5304356.1 hypothetical protein [Phycisphaerales bacterium]